MSATSTASTALDDHRSSQVETILRNEYGWTYRLELINLDDIEVLDDQQVRYIANVATPERVAEYADAMKAGAILPAIIVRPYGEKYLLVDGNTRVAAARAIKQHIFPAYIVDIPSGDLARELGARVNQMHGYGLTDDEARRQAEQMIEAGRPDDAIMRVTKMKAPKVRQWRVETHAMDHARRVDVAPEMSQLSAAQRRIIGGKVKMDAPFAELTRLAARAKIPNAELTSIAQDVADAPSEGDMLGIVERAGLQFAPVGKGEKAQVVVNQKAKRMRMVLPQVLNLAPPADVFEPTRAADDLALWEQIAQVTERMIGFYRQMQGGQS